ncbi:hypothetical protein TNCV_4689171 [Trichonephila clavipes]|nr:hypothetical protein TNCV_4689171 [Trichonephila clavipes]
MLVKRNHRWRSDSHPIASKDFKFLPRRTILVDIGTSSELQNLLHLWGKIGDPLGIPLAVQRCDSCKVTYLNLKLVVPILPAFYEPVHRHTSWRHVDLHCCVAY